MLRHDDLSHHPNVMVSSTYTDLVDHREAVIDALLRLGFFPVGMEFDSAKAGKDIIDSSFDMVDRALAYVGIISHRYGGVPQDPGRNPSDLSITELEYRRALDRGIPVYMFLMSDGHLVRRDGVETVEAYQAKLQALKNDARQRSITAEFSSMEELKALVLQSMAECRLEAAPKSPSPETNGNKETDEDETASRQAPALLALPRFIPGHEFIGRRSELGMLDEWAKGEQPVMLVEAIGGEGKSMLAWQWLEQHADAVLPDLAGTIWYSFYEGEADMAFFAAQALAYTTGRPLSEFRGRANAALAPLLIKELRRRRFLIVLDGLERLLVAYNRLDASQARDDQVSSTRDDRSCIKPQDTDLLRQLANSTPSKILLTSRLVPTAFTNRTGQMLPSVHHYQLTGLHPSDAFVMMRKLGIRGDGETICRYLDDNFGNHSLLLGVVAGLVRDYPRDPGNFNRWVEDPQAGAGLALSQLDLSQRRVHILGVALGGLERGSRQLLSRLAALSGAVPFETLDALNPFLPEPPGGSEESEIAAFESSEEFRQALPRLVSTIQDLERRGLLQWDRQRNSYDLHPVV